MSKLNLNYTDSHILWYSKAGLCDSCKKKSEEVGEVKGFCDACKEKHRLVIDAIIYTREEFKSESLTGIINKWAKLKNKMPGLPDINDTLSKLKDLNDDKGDD